MRATVMTCCLAVVLSTVPTHAYTPLGLSIDFDPPNGVVRIDPQPPMPFTAYIVATYVDQPNRAPATDAYGLERVALTAQVTNGAAWLMSVDLTDFHPDATTVSGGFGDTENGWIIEAPECVTAGPGESIIIAELLFMPTGPPGEILIGPHPTEGSACLRCGVLSGPYEFKVCGTGGLGQDPGEPYSLCGFPHTRVICEPQRGDNPSHPNTYWYDVTVGYGPDPYGPCEGFHVRVYDPDIENYTNWVQPMGWTHADSLIRVGDELWVSWWTPDPNGMFCDGWHRFQFDNPNDASWGDWTLTNGSNPDPYTSVVRTSGYFGAAHDGYGRCVHVPSTSTDIQDDTSSWGVIKALYQ